ncbi:Zinc finger protein enhydrous [Thalictrum thalictroides]|uniref:Zinc finger protein enhydrous n=1 Tax=Thalictrum thalictroides TaxID=46969 RepID=A0A7J6X3D5_THATH|nr:Zinc finger protein enhydrous [Thalictrum thalictroides]
MATNRFVCEICNKGFQRDQNLQLHRRGHNLPWKLRQRSTTEIRKRVYVCPETSCVHHDPSRALGDLTGIKKHFCRKHGEKKWKCEKCSKKYAVQSDWKAHLKTCGTREYRCDCGTLFSRRDSFITHRAFCDALAEESAKSQIVPISVPEEGQKSLQSFASSSSSPPLLPSPAPVPLATSPPTVEFDALKNQKQNQNRDLPENTTGILRQIHPSTCINGSSGSSSTSSSNNSIFANLFASSSMGGGLQPQTSSFSDLICAMARSERPTGFEQGSGPESTSLCLSTSNGSNLFTLEDRQFAPPTQPTMSATALLQKAAQMGATATNGSFLRSLGVSMSSSSGHQDNLQWNDKIESEPSSAVSGLAIGRLPCDGNTRLTELMMGPSTLFGPEPTTLDFLGLGMSGNGRSKDEYSALMSSIDDSLNIAAAAAVSFGGGNLSREDA